MSQLKRWNTPHAPSYLSCSLGERPIHSRCSKSTCGLYSDRFCVSLMTIAWSAKTHATFLVLKIHLWIQIQLWWKEKHPAWWWAGVVGSVDSFGASSNPNQVPCVQSGGWSQLCYLSHQSHPLWLKTEGGNVPSVCPIEFTVNPVYSKTFWHIYCFLDKPFSLGTIHICSLYALECCMGKVYLQERTQEFQSALFKKMNMEYMQMGWLSYSGIIKSWALDIDTPATELQLCCFPDTCQLKQVSQCCRVWGPSLVNWG